MKTVIMIVTILVSNVCMADLASQLASAISESSQAKKANENNLQVDLNSVKATFTRSGAVTTIKDSKAALIEDAPSTIVNNESEVDDKNIPETVSTISAELKESRSLAFQNK